MWKGRVVSLHITHAEGAPMRSLQEVYTVPGRGIEGDRYYLGTGHFSPHFSPSHEITLIELETIHTLNRELTFEIAPGDARRNIVSCGVPLNHLVRREFLVGEVRLRGIRLCEPCLHIAQLTHPDLLSSLIHRGGLRAQILMKGWIRVGDTIEVIPRLTTYTLLRMRVSSLPWKYKQRKRKICSSTVFTPCKQHAKTSMLLFSIQRY